MAPLLIALVLLAQYTSASSSSICNDLLSGLSAETRESIGSEITSFLHTNHYGQSAIGFGGFDFIKRLKPIETRSGIGIELRWDFGAPPSNRINEIVKSWLKNNGFTEGTDLFLQVEAKLYQAWNSERLSGQLFNSPAGSNENTSTGFLYQELESLSLRKTDRSYKDFMYDSAGISFYAECALEGAKGKVILNTVATRELSKRLGVDVAYEGIVKFPKKMAKVGLAFSDFHLMAGGNAVVDETVPIYDVFDSTLFDRGSFDRALIIASAIKSFRVQMSFAQSTEWTRLKIEGPVSFGSFVRPRKSPFVKDKNGDYILAVLFSKADSITRLELNPPLDLMRMNRLIGEMESIFTNPQLHRSAKRLLMAKGIDGINYELGKYGYRVGEPNSERIELLNDFLKKIGLGDIPYEAGSFGIKHGPYSHHLQYFSLLSNFSDEARNTFKALNLNMSSSSQERLWSLWILMFDSTSGLANDPRYWRDL